MLCLQSETSSSPWACSRSTTLPLPRVCIFITSAEVANAPNGTHQVDGDTIYRIASVTKLFTVYASLLELDSTEWDRPLTNFFPPLIGTSSRENLPPVESEWSHAVIPGDPISFSFDVDIRKPSGGLLSIIQDLAKFGVGILNCTLLPSVETSKWMKPLSHTPRLQSSVGAPWEIARYTHADSGVVTDLYAKGGDSGHYSSFFVLVSDFDVGFSILVASTSAKRLTTIGAIGDLMTDVILPALMAQAAAEAERNLGGSYASTVEGLNSSLTLSLNQSEGAPPGLMMSRFISNGTDMLLTPPELARGRPTRLLPSLTDAATGQIAFRAVGDADASRVQVGTFSDTIVADWISADVSTYGGLSTGLFVFALDSSGKALAVNPAAYRVKLERTDG